MFRSMPATVAALLASFWTIAPMVPARADTEVRFITPERFADQEFKRSASRAEAMAVFERFLIELGERYLRKGQSLDIEVLDVQLAGDYASWWSVMNDVRVLTAATPPRFNLRYTLRENRRVLAEARESITDVNYLTNPAARASVDPFIHEKVLLESWFRKRFADPRPDGAMPRIGRAS